MMNGRPLGVRKKVQLLVILTLLAWATQTLFHQWGYGAERRIAPPAEDVTAPSGHDMAPEKFVPGTGDLQQVRRLSCEAKRASPARR